MMNSQETAVDTHIKLWDGYTGAILHRLSGHEQGINVIAWAPDGDFLAAASDDKTTRVWGVEFVHFEKCVREENMEVRSDHS